jgi:hypothetical protein
MAAQSPTRGHMPALLLALLLAVVAADALPAMSLVPGPQGRLPVPAPAARPPKPAPPSGQLANALILLGSTDQTLRLQAFCGLMSAEEGSLCTTSSVGSGFARQGMVCIAVRHTAAWLGLRCSIQHKAPLVAHALMLLAAGRSARSAALDTSGRRCGACWKTFPLSTNPSLAARLPTLAPCAASSQSER